MKKFLASLFLLSGCATTHAIKYNPPELDQSGQEKLMACYESEKHEVTCKEFEQFLHDLGTLNRTQVQ